MRFGTDGLRGRADTEVTPAVAYRLGRAVATVFPGEVAYVGADTRASSPLLVAAAVAGLRDGGVPAVNLGVVPTPAVAVITARRGGVGVVVSASHNPHVDNGLKVLGHGAKLDAVTEQAVQDAFDAAPGRDGPFADVAVDPTGASEYLAVRRDELAPDDLSGLHVVLDCANGAASAIAPTLFQRLGATVDVIHNQPDGRNINHECGSTHPASLVERVRATHADLGLAFDGDADRLIAVDSHGRVRDGDDLMVVFALDLHARGLLGDAIVVTQMSNLGLHRAMREAQIKVVETEVGDRAVLAALEERDLTFGGEQSGHLIFRDRSPAGDGLLTGLLLCDLVRRKGRLAAMADAAWTRVPQRLLSIPRDRYDAPFVTETATTLAVERHVTPRDYRLVVRPSGTEPVIRVMVESVDGPFVEGFVERLRTRFDLAS